MIQDFERVFRMLEVKSICQACSLLYEAYGIFLISKGRLVEAHDVYQLGVSRFVYILLNGVAANAGAFSGLFYI